MGESADSYARRLASKLRTLSPSRRLRHVELTPSAVVPSTGARFNAGGLMAEYVPLNGTEGFGYQWIGRAHYLAIHDLHLADGETFCDESVIDRRRDLRGMLTFVPAKSRIWGWAVPRSPGQSFTALYLDPTQMEDDLAQKVRLVPPQPMLYFLNPALRATLEKIQTALDPKTAHEPIYIESLCLVAMFELCVLQRENLAAAAQPPGRLAPGREQIVFDYVDANLHKDIRLTDLAQLTGLSRFHFLKVFKQTTQETPYQYLLRRRIERAEILLRSGSASVAEIALAVGFKDSTRFIRAFRRLHGVTPRAYRA